MIDIQPLDESHYSGIVDLYNHYIETSACTFDIEPYSIADRRPWFDQFAEPYRCYVATDGGEVAGYACAMQFRTKAAYQSSVEVSVYASHERKQRGVGSAMYETLFSYLDTTDLHRAYAGVTLPNEASIRLHEKFGFEKNGHYREVGFKFDRYWDVAWFERAIGT